MASSFCGGCCTKPSKDVLRIQSYIQDGAFAKKVNGFNPYSPMMEFFYKMLLSEEVFNQMNIFGFIFEKKILFGPNIPKYLFVSLN